MQKSDTSLPLGGSEEGRPELAAATVRARGLVKVVKRDRMDLCEPAPSLLERDLVLPLWCGLSITERAVEGGPTRPGMARSPRVLGRVEGQGSQVLSSCQVREKVGGQTAKLREGQEGRL